MIYKRLLLLVLMPFLMALSCQKREFGENSIFYYLNDKPKIPYCINHYHPEKSVEIKGDTLNLNICGHHPITYNIKNFTGKGRYIVNVSNPNTCTYDYDNYWIPVDDKTYLHVLDLDTIEHHFEAVFEAELEDEFHQRVSITKGRMDVHY